MTFGTLEIRMPFIVYKNFRRCLTGAARDRWDLINVLDEGEIRDYITFQFHIREFTTAILGNQKPKRLFEEHPLARQHVRQAVDQGY
jgi:hypothetical protein